ncbi:uncharacterized protein LOC122079720 [Macadamia integrifolia]|uniref:uncharacterized protein LOC122079720 n=1 Tax=Macadamia integrifolia TaxID=60698 RepID=UPI001C4E6824|nr:uncharacterized protein LOC122079720 [Macadamia integrifolia]
METVEETKPGSGAGEKDKKEVKDVKEKEGRDLLGSPTFKELENGRFKCIETGHEMPAKEMGSYGESKRCRLGLIDAALSLKKPPLNMFKQDPLSRSKLICKLTGDTINKSEEHIWKHINGRRFLNKLEQKEQENLASCGTVLEESKQLSRKVSKPKVNGKQLAHKASKLGEDGKQLAHKAPKLEEDGKQLSHKVSKPEVNGVDMDLKNSTGLDVSEPRRPSDNESDSEEDDFWIPPVGSRWDNDDGGDRWGSGTDSEQESEEGIKVDGVDGSGTESGELSRRTKRISIEVGPSSFASRKKKSKTNN